MKVNFVPILYYNYNFYFNNIFYIILYFIIIIINNNILVTNVSKSLNYINQSLLIYDLGAKVLHKKSILNWEKGTNQRNLFVDCLMLKQVIEKSFYKQNKNNKN